jgi:hypothetical protein
LDTHAALYEYAEIIAMVVKFASGRNLAASEGNTRRTSMQGDPDQDLFTAA